MAHDDESHDLVDQLTLWHTLAALSVARLHQHTEDIRGYSILSACSPQPERPDFPTAGTTVQTASRVSIRWKEY